jgi:hypothetical protein
MKRTRPIGSAFVAILLTSLLAWSSPAAAAASTFSGRAAAVQGNVLGVPVALADTGEVNPSGDSLEASVLQYPVAGLPDPTNGALTAEVLHATVVAHGNKSSAEASIANVALNTGGHSISADFLMAEASATCNAGSASVAGSAEVAGLTVNGQSIVVSGQANQQVPLPVGLITINEQIADSSVGAGHGGLTVNALHIVIPGVTDLTVASAHADITCGASELCPNRDFVTGGGWITTSSGSRANFAVGGGIKNGAFWGHLTYIDHAANGVRAKGTGVTGYTVTGPTSRHIDGNADASNGAPSYHVDVTDAGEPGHGVDWFGIVLGDYSQGAYLGGGNIQLHCG